jgi:hypothetical protein
MSDEQSKWKILLENFCKENVQHAGVNNEETEKQKERVVTENFINIIEQDSGKDDIPRFYFKKQVYNELYYNIKSEAKQRFLSVKSYEIPQKRRKYITTNK